jgi:hypothetical protein
MVRGNQLRLRRQERVSSFKSDVRLGVVYEMNYFDCAKT